MNHKQILQYPLWYPLPLYDKESKILIDWSAKGGSHLITTLFFDHMDLLKKASAKTHWIHDYRTQVFQGSDLTKNYPLLLEDILLEDVYKIKIVRNPFTRAVSSYYGAMNNWDKMISRFGLSQSETSFVDFLRFIKEHPDGDIHWKPQVRDIEKEHSNFFTIICRLENLEDDFQIVNKQIGTKFSTKLKDPTQQIYMGHHRKYNNKIKPPTSDKSFASVPWRSLPNKKQSPLYKYFYNHETCSLVSKIFSEDISKYNYSYDLLESREDFENRMRITD